MSAFNQPEQQLVVEIFVRDIELSKTFYERLGFTIAEDRGSFVVLDWGGHMLLLEEQPDQEPSPSSPQSNVRIMVPDVDRYWAMALDMDAPVHTEIDDRYYGLRDFTIVDPGGIGLRFSTRIDSSLRIWSTSTTSILPVR